MSEKEIAVVTGASSGIGAATARLLAKNGYHVIAAARRIERLRQLVDEDSNIEQFKLDITSQIDVDSLAKYLKGKSVSVLVNNAGGAFDSATIVDSDPDVWRKTYEVNVIGTVRMIKAITPIMLAFGRGHIVIVSSTAGHRTYEFGGNYVAAKHAERTLAETLRLELNGQPIRVTEIAPGMVKTEEFAKVRYGDVERAAKVYEGVAEPLLDVDIAETIRWSVMLPHHVNIDSMLIRPVAQAQAHKVHRTK
ncbi:MAG: SDR family NAD(P)-dependent oxidoreductase [Actinobacteria bacterium]|nr:SDR family NAD(P)-dependent oxidoreductase [Actinomycetota bacterium]